MKIKEVLQNVQKKYKFLWKKIKKNLLQKHELCTKGYLAGTRQPRNTPWRSSKAPNLQDPQGTFRGLLVDQYKNGWSSKKNVF